MLYLLLSLLLLLSCSPKSFKPLSTEGYSVQIKTLETRDTGLDYLLVHRKKGSGFKKALILFPGGNGICHFGKHQSFCQKKRNYLNGVWVSNNFLARNVLRFARRGDLVVLVDVPQDIKERFTGRNSKIVASAYRISEEHYEDIKNLISELKDAFGVEEFYLIGTSRGTISVAYLTGRIPEVRGAVLTATVASDPHFMDYCPSETDDFLSCTGFERANRRVLFVHHRLDGCVSSGYPQARMVFQKLKAKEKKFITVDGGSEPADDPCFGLTYHGFFGKDTEVVEKVLDWIHSGG